LGMRERGALEWARDTVENIYVRSKTLVFRINPKRAFKINSQINRLI
jgi:hypothetical protein